jgi:bifunctional non-homologous end joining protein LigD
VARTRNGFTPASREALFRRFTGLEVVGYPFANLPKANGGGWGEGLTVEKMWECRWLVPVLVGRVGFLEWTVHGHLRHSRFIRLREDRQARDAQRGGATAIWNAGRLGVRRRHFTDEPTYGPLPGPPLFQR